MARIFFCVDGFFREKLFCVGRSGFRNFGGRGVTRAVREARERKLVHCTATLMKNSKRIRSRKRRRNSIINEKWKRFAEAGNDQFVFTVIRELRKISFENFLICGRRK